MWPPECGSMSAVDAEEARAAVRQQRQAVDAAEAAAAQARQQFHELLAVLQGQRILTQSELVDLSGYKREHLRRIARSAGIQSQR